MVRGKFNCRRKTSKATRPLSGAIFSANYYYKKRRIATAIEKINFMKCGWLWLVTIKSNLGNDFVFLGYSISTPIQWLTPFVFQRPPFSIHQGNNVRITPPCNSLRNSRLLNFSFSIITAEHLFTIFPITTFTANKYRVGRNISDTSPNYCTAKYSCFLPTLRAFFIFLSL